LLWQGRRHTIGGLNGPKDDGVSTPSGIAGARSAQVDGADELSGAVERIGLGRRSLAVVIIGGADGMGDGEREALERLFAESLAPFVEAAGGVVVDGGTDSGVMRASGRARAATGAGYPLVGVVPAGVVETAVLEPNHTHFLFVPGSRFGDESPWLPLVGAALGERLLCLLAGGGAVARADVEENRAAGLPVLALRGSGGLADELAALGTVESAPLDDPPVVGDALRRLVA
jgi:hypothetical protein